MVLPHNISWIRSYFAVFDKIRQIQRSNCEPSIHWLTPISLFTELWSLVEYVLVKAQELTHLCVVSLFLLKLFLLLLLTNLSILHLAHLLRHSLLLHHLILSKLSSYKQGCLVGRFLLLFDLLSLNFKFKFGLLYLHQF